MRESLRSAGEYNVDIVTHVAIYRDTVMLDD
jgi:hypothetical protein